MHQVDFVAAFTGRCPQSAGQRVGLGRSVVDVCVAELQARVVALWAEAVDLLARQVRGVRDFLEPHRVSQPAATAGGGDGWAGQVGAKA